MDGSFYFTLFPIDRKNILQYLGGKSLWFLLHSILSFQ